MPTGTVTIETTQIDWLQEPTCGCELPQEVTLAFEMNNVYDRTERIEIILAILSDEYKHWVLNMEYKVIGIYPAVKA